VEKFDHHCAKKASKLDYTALGAYHPIVLLNTMANILSACITDVLVYMAETHNMLPDNHFGCTPRRSTTDSLHFITKYVKDAWRKGEVVSTLFLDVKSTFPSMMLGKLLHDLRTRGVLAEYTECIRLKVTGRTTTLFEWICIRACLPAKGDRPGVPTVQYPFPILQCRPD